MKIKLNNLEWKVFNYNVNQHLIHTVNIFKYSHIFELSVAQYQKNRDVQEFEHNIKANLQYMFWCRSEYEIVLTPLFNHKESEELKIDIYEQIMINWDKFFNYLLNEVNKQLEEKDA